MKSLAECVYHMNRLFGNQFGRWNVIALWPTEKLRDFSSEELSKLENLTRDAMLEGGDKTMMNRLLIRIRDAREDRGNE